MELTQQDKAKDISLLKDRFFTIRLTGQEMEDLTRYCRQRKMRKGILARQLLANVLSMD